MKTLELFSGTQSFSKIARSKDFETFCVDNNNKFNNDLTINIQDIKINDLPKEINILWASPPCTTFSVASMWYHWNIDNTPKTTQAKEGLKIIDKTIKIIKNLLENNKSLIWYIENPRGKLRKQINPIFEKHDLKFVLHTITYCQYGDNRMKPTDIWTNNRSWKSKPMCKNGMPCHVRSPRGSQTGTQGLKKTERSIVPPELIKEILNDKNIKGEIIR